jgi:cellulose synthase/poly-beta-1,6-N-acetylglucosamine synthase-like glycosyltransferase
MSTIAASYVLPLRASTPDPELRDYVRWLAETVADVVVVDASPDEVRAVHEGWWGTWVRHLPPDPAHHCRNGKVRGVLTGLDRARHDVVVIADDDVRWDRDGLRRVVDLLESTELVAPANYYDPLPWHARYDTGSWCSVRWAATGPAPSRSACTSSRPQAVGTTVTCSSRTWSSCAR